METILIMAVVGTLNVVCFFVGAKVGQTVVKGKEIETPKIPSPITAYKAHREAKEAEAEKNRLDVILANIERYDGTGNGQEDVPRG
jgi:hypothetical protein